MERRGVFNKVQCDVYKVRVLRLWKTVDVEIYCFTMSHSQMHFAVHRVRAERRKKRQPGGAAGVVS